ncbi:Bug family tripartite tricarboxylate transporter substrate binding protein [Achromobacter xylosoxidans]|uniref:Bug family tripartite tricarboxylate transporter substrate binding protein n=1 Tax=Alcaligenes xylosoxydans xylosoxydans TaxID=85698 RepID=UPI001F1297B9|nr:tripartite tricarboxylate transporter substrate binding protein [Achromobacter xylosoxidans]
MHRAAIFLSCFVLYCAGVQASPWPERPITLIVPYPAGGGVDTAARIYSAAISKPLGRQIVVENRAGASGAIGAQAVVRAAPDGYTFLLSSPAEVLVTPIAGQPLPYDPEKDLTPIAFVGDTPLGIVAHPERGPKSLGELVANSHRPDVKFNYGTPGSGSTMHFAGAAMQAMAGVNWQHVPYKGAAPAVNDVLGGQIDFVITGLPPLVTHIKAGKLTLLAVTSADRSPLFADVPAISELPAMAGYQFTNWLGLFGPARLPPEIGGKLSAAFEDAVKDEAVRQRLQEAGWRAVVLKQEAFGQFLTQERARYRAVRDKAEMISE